MMSTCVKLLNPISGEREQTLFTIATIAGRRSVPALLCGAFARDILFWHMHGIETRRATLDVDICVQVPGWEHFDTLGNDLRQNGFTNCFDDHPEKFVDNETGQEVDILPFGEIAEDGRTVVWPEDHSSWSIMGLQDAFEHCLYLEVAYDVKVMQLPFVSAPALVMLKIIAVHDRPQDRYKKDGTDIGFVIEKYLDAGGKERLKTAPNDDIMAKADGDLDIATALLIGRDISTIAGADACHCVLELLDLETAGQGRCYLARGLQKGYCKGDFTRARSILRALAGGLRSGE